MTIRYVGPGGSDSNNGLTWATRKLTLNGVEDTPVVAGDTVYVGPGVYRESLQCDVAGTSGNPITYIGDWTGENTDGIGGDVRITGSDNDQTSVRSNGIHNSTSNIPYRTFRGFSFDTCSNAAINTGSGGSNNWIVEDCYFSVFNNYGINFTVTTGDHYEIRRCVFEGNGYGITFYNGIATNVDATTIVENCVFNNSSASGGGIFCWKINNVTIRNCLVMGCNYGIRATALSASTSITVNNCIVHACYYGLHAGTSGQLVEDYNCVPNTSTNPRTNVTVGSNSNSYPPLLEPSQLLKGFQFLWNIFSPSKWSQIARIGGTSEASEDLYGITRPTVSGKKSWGAVQYQPAIREITITKDSSTASLSFPDAGSHQIFLPVTGDEITVSVFVYREANYAGTLPRMIIKEPGVSDRITTDTGSASQFNELTNTFTPSGNTDYVVIELQSLNTATSGSFRAIFDELKVS